MFAGPLIKAVIFWLEMFWYPSLTTMVSASAIDGNFQRKKRGRGALARSGVGVVRVAKEITLVILNEDMSDNVRIIKPQENVSVLCVLNPLGLLTSPMGCDLFGSLETFLFIRNFGMT